jgi:hypothetical protein
MECTKVKLENRKRKSIEKRARQILFLDLHFRFVKCGTRNRNHDRMMNGNGRSSVSGLGQKVGASGEIQEIGLTLSGVNDGDGILKGEVVMEVTTQRVLEAPGAVAVSEETGALPLPTPDLKPERVQKELLAVIAAAQARRVRGSGWRALPAIGGMVRVRSFGSPRVAAMYGLYATEHAHFREQRVSVTTDGLGQIAILLQVQDLGLTDKGLQFVRDLG